MPIAASTAPGNADFLGARDSLILELVNFREVAEHHSDCDVAIFLAEMLLGELSRSVPATSYER